METKNKPLINYIIIAIVILTTFGLCYYVIVVYNLHKNDTLNASILGQYLNEIKLNELNDYIMENNETFLYICSSDIDRCRDFENSIKEKIENNSLRDHILYLNVKDVKDEYGDKYISEIKKYINNFNEADVPQIVVYNSSNIVEIKKIIMFDDILQLLDKYEVNYIND